MIVLREFEPDDLEALVELTRDMWSEAPEYREFPFQASKIGQWGKLCLTSPDWLCVLAWEEVDGVPPVPIGFVAAGAVEMLFSDQKTVDDLGLFVRPERRGSAAAVRLLRYLEEWARHKGLLIKMGITTGTNTEQAAKFFSRFGYRKSGELWTKAL